MDILTAQNIAKFYSCMACDDANESMSAKLKDVVDVKCTECIGNILIYLLLIRYLTKL